jgi:hypothetical protein
LRVFLAQDSKYLFAVVTPVFFKVSQEGSRQGLYGTAALEKDRLDVGANGDFRVGR